MRAPSKQKQEQIITFWEGFNRLQRVDCDFETWLQLKFSCSIPTAQRYAGWFFSTQHYKDWRAKATEKVKCDS